ncbi:DUF1361 domain-containing protein [Aphanothece hegewaldii CCALA 016]|uniref:DUF1361 domain-containing protein n=2 Tax=Aphanothece TaxID=1121 RepID=A0A2T1LWS4_9CHRO|nr:DUF1361 domain-containing protein [Aphanothece hegewaldii CCALA 016]
MQIIRYIWKALDYSHSFMAWNLFLAFIPLVLSIFLFRFSQKRSLFWWFIFLTFLAFLPNAPYVLTDVIHLIDLIRFGFSVWIITLVLIPQYTFFILAGFIAYVLSVINLGFYLENQGYRKYVLSSELIIHLLSGIGIYLGRFQRFNSWDFVTRPIYLLKISIEQLTDKEPILVIIITTFVITFLYWLLKQVILGLELRFKENR